MQQVKKISTFLSTSHLGWLVQHIKHQLSPNLQTERNNFRSMTSTSAAPTMVLPQGHIVECFTCRRHLDEFEAAWGRSILSLSKELEEALMRVPP
jgi:hypothetical protein